MAVNGFLELLRLSRRGGQISTETDVSTLRWSGVSFEFMSHHFVAPIGDVQEVISVPSLTKVPLSKPWLLGLANVRGRILTVVDLNQFLTGQSIEHGLHSKVLCFSTGSHYIGVVVDHVLGVQHFHKQSYSMSNQDLNGRLAQLSQGCFNQYQQIWHIFQFSQLLKDESFTHTSELYIQ